MGKKITKPLYQADWQQIDKMCAISCTGEEMASVLGVDYDTLVAACKRDHKSRFSEYIKQKSLGGKMSLRRKQYTTAMEGNVTMLIWLGKNLLGQVDKQELELSLTDELSTMSQKVLDEQVEKLIQQRTALPYDKGTGTQTQH